MNRRLIFVAALAVLPLLGVASFEVTVSALNVRTGPGTGYSVMGQVYYGQQYVEIDVSGAWTKIWYDNRTGWVYNAYTNYSWGTPMSVTASTLNVRTGPGTGYEIIGTAPAGSWWSVTGSDGDWRQIFYGGAVAWCHGAYLSADGGGTTPTGPPTSAAGFIQMPAGGSGFYAYVGGDRRWGTPAMVYGLIDAAASWGGEHPEWDRISIGDISRENGGYFPPHASHRVGKDVDIGVITNDNSEGYSEVGWSNYSYWRNRDLIVDHLAQHLDIKVIFLNDPDIQAELGYVQEWPGHENHLHVRIW